MKERIISLKLFIILLYIINCITTQDEDFYDDSEFFEEEVVVEREPRINLKDPEIKLKDLKLNACLNLTFARMDRDNVYKPLIIK